MRLLTGLPASSPAFYPHSSLAPISASDHSSKALFYLGFPGGSVVKNLIANAGDTGSIPGSGRSPGEGMATHSSILAWEIPWTKESGGPHRMGSQRVGHNLAHTASFISFL